MFKHESHQKQLLKDYSTMLTQEEQFSVSAMPVNNLQRYISVNAGEIKRRCEFSRSFEVVLQKAIPKLIQILRQVISKRMPEELPKSPKPLLLLGEVSLQVTRDCTEKKSLFDHQMEIFVSHNAPQYVQSDYRIFDLSAQSLAKLEEKTILYWNLRKRVDKALRLWSFVFNDLFIAKHLNWKTQSIQEMEEEVTSLECLTKNLLHIAERVLAFSDETRQKMVAVKWHQKRIVRIRTLFRSRLLKSIILRRSSKDFTYGVDPASSHDRPSTTAVVPRSPETPMFTFTHPDDPFNFYKITRCRSSSLACGKFNVHIRIPKKATGDRFLQIMYTAAKAFNRVIKAQEDAVKEIALLKKEISSGFRRSFVRFFFFTISEEVLFWKRLSMSPQKDFASQQGCDVYRYRQGVFEMISDLPACATEPVSWKEWWHDPLEGKTDCPSVVLDHDTLQSQEKFDAWLEHILFCNLSYQQCESYCRKLRLRIVVRRGSLCISMDQVYAFLGTFHSSVCRGIIEERSPRLPVIRILPSTSLVFVNDYGEICIPWNATATELSCTLAAKAMSKALPAPEEDSLCSHSEKSMIRMAPEP
ncbi:hypothetical protein XU18_4919 [Perkinsela sp. CCAP 1560/4]|nr:hypothetical protein XU18_4919 [Perkinsela sp. CCAP 1560/4]|eukprot:KNH03724.1 hypothetical protein XU18_4919 [Perkinsela sp. CCAP 1560/4]